MRRTDRELREELAWKILKNHDHGVLSLVLPDGNPYGVPVNYGVFDRFLVFHGANEGQKIDAIDVFPKASFCVVGASDVDKATLSTHYASTIVSGPIRKIVDFEEKRIWLIRLLAHYGISERDAMWSLSVDIPATTVLVLDVEAITAKGFEDAVKPVAKGSTRP